MLKFVNEIPVYDFDEACVVFTGLSWSGPVICQVTRSAVLARAGLKNADARHLLAAFQRDRQFFEDIACVLHVRGLDGIITIDDSHLTEPAFAHWQPHGRSRAATVMHESRVA